MTITKSLGLVSSDLPQFQFCYAFQISNLRKREEAHLWAAALTFASVHYRATGTRLMSNCEKTDERTVSRHRETAA